MNFSQDIINDIQKELHHWKIKTNKSNDFFDVLLDYLTFKRKYIPVKKRNIFLSKELKKSILTHPKAVEVLTILHDTVNGNDLNSYQSDTLTQTRFHDRLLYNWHIHHLHLSTENEKNSYWKKRNNNLLFVVFHNNRAFFLDTAKHNYGIFADENWLRIIKNNWPFLLNKFHGDELFQETQQLKPSDRQMIWDKGYTVGITNVDGVIYVDSGFGTTASGHSFQDVGTANEILRFIYDIETWINDNKIALNEYILKTYPIATKELVFKARLSKNGIEIYEQISNHIITTYQ